MRIHFSNDRCLSGNFRIEGLIESQYYVITYFTFGGSA
jgi:hypothetical protein